MVVQELEFAMNRRKFILALIDTNRKQAICLGFFFFFVKIMSSVPDNFLVEVKLYQCVIWEL